MRGLGAALLLVVALAGAALAGTIPEQKPLNDRVRVALMELGDDGTQPREVIHYAYPMDGARETEDLVAELRAMGLDVRAAQADDGLAMVEVVPVAGEDFDARTGALTALLQAAGWAYDGWECAVVKP